MEKALVRGRRLGRRMAVEVDDSRGARPVVTLREIAEASGLEVTGGPDEAPAPAPPPAPGPEPGPTAEPAADPREVLRDLGLGRRLKPLAEELGSPGPLPAEPAPPAPEPPPRRAFRDAPVPCARCGQTPGEPLGDPPTDADKLAYVEAVLGGRPYEKRYSLLGGRLGLTFAASTPAEYAAGQALLGKKGAMGHFRTDDEALNFALSFRVAMALRLVRAGDALESHDPLPVPADIRDHDELMRFEGAVAGRLAAIGQRLPLAIQAAARFEDNYRTLTLRALDPGFWDGIAGK
jgi:hypothetical protein